ncbi:alpha/beta fold hydrolase [Nocardia arthritidis]|uniref:Alpha/beta fold hydrolase n=1 Tax=Nocardia arthritidis TaxID=228602 RepID=A0A6G9YEQ2_9NOCA|nr:alpha/beta hydrolase [Nocardia arthritidis]QIS11765.1 alpha/beta fold hydrolase [Nocardia arthritidis]
MFDGFEEFDIAVAGTTVHGRIGGAGAPLLLLLLHGIPETHVMWHRVAPALAEEHTVVVTDLRGFGASGKPASTADHAPYAMRALAADQVEVMKRLGHNAFGVAGHDRGGRCAYRMALDHPDNVTGLAVLDIVPTCDAFDNADMKFSLGYWVWSFLAAPYPVPETLIANDPATLVNHMLDTWSTDPSCFTDEIRSEYIDKFSPPETIHAICEEYRAAATLDYHHDRKDKGSRLIRCPVLALWATDSAVAEWYDPLRIWRDWAVAVRGKPIPGGHFIAEENPAAVTTELLNFFADVA